MPNGNFGFRAWGKWFDVGIWCKDILCDTYLYTDNHFPTKIIGAIMPIDTLTFAEQTMNAKPKSALHFEIIRIEILGHDAPHVDWKSMGRFPSHIKALTAGRLTRHNEGRLFWIDYPCETLGVDQEMISNWFIKYFESGTYTGYFIILDHHTA